MPSNKKGKNKSQLAIAEARESAPVSVKEARRGLHLYSPALCEQIILRIGNGEKTLAAICREEQMPSWMTVHRWMDEYPDFRERVYRARALARMRFEDECLDLADGKMNEIPDYKAAIDTRFKLLDRADAVEREHNKPKDPKLVEASKDEGGAWRMTDDGKRVNPISEAIEGFMRKKGIAASET